MTTRALPPALAHTVVNDGVAIQMAAGFLEFETDSGATTKSKFPGTVPDDVTWQIFCSSHDVRDAWMAFYRYECRGGTDAFSYFGYTYNWVAGPAFQKVDSLRWRGSIALKRE